MFVSHMKSLIIVISQMSFFQSDADTQKIKNLTNNHFQMKNNKNCELDHF